MPFAPPKQVDLGPTNSADMVLTFRNAHDWAGDGSLKAVFLAVYRVLKPGGVFGVVDHRANPGTDPMQDANRLSRLPEAYVINLAQQAGLKLAGISRINANPADPRRRKWSREGYRQRYRQKQPEARQGDESVHSCTATGVRPHRRE